MEEQMKETQPDLVPQTLEDILGSLQGFGIEEFEEILTVKSKGKLLHFRISNMCPEEELKALIAAEELKGHAWIQRIKCEILSRAITFLGINDRPGINIRQLSEKERFVRHPKSGDLVDIQVALRDSLLGWGQELVGVLWKVLMVHSQKIEDAMFEQFPDTSVMTEVERRFMEQAMQEIEEASRRVIAEEASQLDKEEKEETV